MVLTNKNILGSKVPGLLPKCTVSAPYVHAVVVRGRWNSTETAAASEGRSNGRTTVQFHRMIARDGKVRTSPGIQRILTVALPKRAYQIGRSRVQVPVWCLMTFYDLFFFHHFWLSLEFWSDF